MEQKKLKAPIYSNECIFNNSAEIPIDVDFSLPDYCPDINKILKCKAVSRIASKGINGRNLTVDGSVTVTVIYCDGEQKVNAYEYQYPFSKTFETGIEIDTATVKCKTKCEYINCRAVTGRKIDIHGAAGVYIKVNKRKCTDVITDFDDSDIELLRGSIPATLPMGCAEKYVIMEEELKTGDSQPPVYSLIRYDSAVTVKESKLIAGKAVVKGELIVTVLYCSEDGSFQTVRANIPFSQMLEIEGITDSCECETKSDIAYLEIKPRVGASGEAKSFQLNAKIHICCESFCNNDVDIVLDAYSRKYQADIIKDDICFNKIKKNITECFSCKKSLDFNENSISKIIDLWSDAKTESVKCSDNILYAKGVVTAYIIACNSAGETEFYEKPVEFEYKYDLNESIKGITCEPQIEVSSCSYNLISDKSLELRVELCINAAVYSCNNVKLITDVKTDENKKICEKSDGAMTIYFADSGENIWDIARKYKAKLSEIKQINEIEEEILQENKMIMIPIN